MKLLSKNNRRMFCVLLFAAICFASLRETSAHRYHTSLARVEYNDKEKLLEITVQTFSHDLEAALEKHHGKRVSLDKTPNVEQIIVKYLSENFVVKNQKGETKQLRWIGKEQQTDTVWLYLEAEMPEGIEGATLDNRFMFETFNDQINLVSARYDNQKNDLIFRPNDKAKSLTASK